MKSLPKVLHIVDDTTAGGVMRVLDFLRSDHELGQTAQHEVTEVTRGKIIGNLGPADVIVSHLAVSWSSLPSLIALRIRFARTPLVHVEHSYTEEFVARNVTHRKRFKTLLKTAYSLFNRVVCVSNGQADWMVSNRLVHPDTLSTIQSCVELSAFRDLPAPKGPARIFAAIGRLDEQKGFDTLIDAFRQTTDPDIQLHIIGEGAQEDALRVLAADDPRISFKGFQHNSAAAFTAVDVVVMPSRWEAYGLVAIEALAAGRRLICNDIDGLKDHEKHGATLFDTTNVAALSDLIAMEARGEGQGRPISVARATKQLERRFRDSWRYMLTSITAQCYTDDPIALLEV